MKYLLLMISVLIIFACAADDPPQMEVWDPQEHGCLPADQQPQDELPCRSQEN